MQNLVEQYPTLEQHLYSSKGELRAFVNLFLGENNIKDLQGLDTPLNEGDTLRLIPSIAGGLNDCPRPEKMLPDYAKRSCVIPVTC